MNLKPFCYRWARFLFAIPLLLAGTSGCHRQAPANTSPEAVGRSRVVAEPSTTDVEDEAAMASEVLSIAIVNAANHGAIDRVYALEEAPTLAPFLRRFDGVDALQKALGEVKSIGPSLATRLIELDRDATPFAPSTFPSQMPLKILTKDKLQELFGEGPEVGWTRFHREKQWGSCIVTASRPAFNKERTKAVVMVWLQRGPLDGEGGFMIATRIGGSWIVHQDWSAPSAVSQRDSMENRSDRVAMD